MISNMPSLDSWVDIANIGVVIALALSFIFGGASIFFSRRQSKQREAQTAREKQVSDEKIAAANEGAAKANREAIRIETASNEKIAGLTKEAEALRAEAERARAERAEADKQIAIAKADAARAKEGIANAEAVSARASVEVARLQVVVANAEQKRAEAERALIELQEKVKPRHLTAEQRARLLELLKANPKGTIHVSAVTGDAESIAFGRELAEVLSEAGWNVGFNDILTFGGTPVGVFITLRSKENVPVRAIILQKALEQVGISAPAELNPNMPEDSVALVVGNKP